MPVVEWMTELFKAMIAAAPPPPPPRIRAYGTFNHNYMNQRSLTRDTNSFLVFRLLKVAVALAMRVYFFLLHFGFHFYNLFTSRIFVTEPEDRLLMISATQAVEMIGKRTLTSSDLVGSYINRIEKINDVINAAVVKNFDEAVREAQDLDNRILDMEDDELAEYIREHPLCGVPFSMKDAFEVEGKVITCGIYSRKNTVCTRTAEVVNRMRKAGGILIAITNVPEVCMWVESVNTIYGRSRNPYDIRRMTGGSSGGEGALLGSAASVVGIGSDIGGSIRMPAFFNGIFGLKPTPGVVSLDGAIPTVSGYKEYMLRVGPMCRYASDLPLLLKIMGDAEKIERLRLDEPVNLKRMRVFYMEGIKENCFIAPLSYDMRFILREGARYFEDKYEMIAHRVDLKLARYAMEFFITSMEVRGGPIMSQYLLSAEGDQGHANIFLELPKFFMGKSKHTLAGIITAFIDGAPIMSDDTKRLFYDRRDRLARELRELLGQDGILLFPSWPTTALFHNQPLLAPMNFAYTALFNALALPVVQCPMGVDKNGLPLGVQVVGAPGSDRLLIAVAKDLEEGFGGWRAAKPL